MKDFENEYLWPILLGLLLGMLLCGCETEAKLQRWFEFKNQQHQNANDNH